MYLKSPRRRREKKFVSGNAHSHISTSPGAEPSAGRMYYGATGRSGAGGRSGMSSRINRTLHKGWGKINFTHFVLPHFFRLTVKIEHFGLENRIPGAQLYIFPAGMVWNREFGSKQLKMQATTATTNLKATKTTTRNTKTTTRTTISLYFLVFSLYVLIFSYVFLGKNF